MLLTAYKYTFSDAEEQAAFGLNLSVEIHQKLNKALLVKEWLCLRYTGNCEFFLIQEEERDSLQDQQKILDILQTFQLVGKEFPESQKIYSGKAAVGRFLKIAAGTAGNSQNKELLEILHESYIKAIKHSYIGPLISRLFHRGIWLHEKIRQETDYFRMAVTQESVLRELAGKVLGSLEQTSIHTIGKASSLPYILEEFRRAGAQKFVFNGSKKDIDEELVYSISGSTKISNRLTSLATSVDILLVFPSKTHHLTLPFLQEQMRKRHYAPLLIFDSSNSLLEKKKLKKINNLYFYTDENIKNVIRFNQNEQQSCAAEIYHWIDQEVDAFYQWLSGKDRFQFTGIIGITPPMQHIFELISRISRTDITVLIDGESGTGKELVAQAIHQLSRRATGSFKPLNCGAIPENLLESELFGHVRGAFTGAVSQKQGLFETANSGTIFLDEIGELPAHLQVKLLRFLQEGEIRRVGSNETIKVNTRVLAATNQKLSKMVAEGSFRSDLYYRLNVIQLTIPPLRERIEDIPLLAKHFLRKFSSKLHKDVNEFSSAAMQALQNYSWPGNVRELENIVERSVALAFGKSISLYDLSSVVQKRLTSSTLLKKQQRLTLKEMEKNYILDTLEACGWNYELASKQLAIGRTTLWRKLREYKMVDS